MFGIANQLLLSVLEIASFTEKEPLIDSANRGNTIADNYGSKVIFC
jgi:hypothetical protein